MKKELKALLLLTISIPIIIHIYFLFKYEINFPFEDGHYVYFNFLYDYLNEDSSIGKFKLFIRSINESRPLLMRAITLKEYYLFGKFNFKYTLIFSNFYVVIILWVYFKKYANSKQWPLVIVSFFSILNLCNFENYFRNDVLLYQTASISLSIFIFYFITLSSNSKSNFSIVVFYFTITLVPFGSAIGYFTLAIVLIYSFFFRGKIYFYPILFILFFHIIFSIFFSETQQSNTNQGILDNLFKYKFDLVKAFFIAFGGCFQVFSNNLGLVFSFVGGLLLLCIPIILFLLKKPQENFHFEILIYIFSLLCIAAIVYKRYGFWTSGYESVLVSRYKIYGVLVFIVLLVLVNSASEKKFLSIFYILGTTCLYTVWLIKTPFLLNLKKETQIMDAFNTKNKIGDVQLNNSLHIDLKKYDYLVRNKIFEPRSVYQDIDDLILNSRYFKTDSIIFEEVDSDPGFNGAWKGRSKRLMKLEVYGNFPKAKNYFISVIDSNNRVFLINGLPPTNSIIKELIKPTLSITKLTKEIDNQYFEMKKPLRCKVILGNIYK